MSQTVVGIFESSSKAQDAVQELAAAGISRDRIDVSGSGSTTGSTGSSYSSDSSYSSGSNSSDDNESGISKFFKNLFGADDDDADKYSRVASQAQSIITVHAQSSDEAEKVADILDDNGAVDVDEHASKMGYGSGSNSGSTSYDTTGSNLATDTTLGLAGAGLGSAAGLGSTSDLTGITGSGFNNDLTGDETRKIPIIEENLEVGKREVNTGGVRVRSRIVARPVEESIRLREERVNVERTAVNRPATDADFSNFQEKDIEMIERAEVPVVSKEARVVEEISIGKDVEERSETIRDTVRKTEVDIEDLEKDTYRNKSNTSSDLTNTNDL